MNLRSWRVWLGTLLTLATLGCGPQRTATRIDSAGQLQLPKAATIYSTDARPHGVWGGNHAARLASAIEKQLGARGDDAKPDGALSATAGFILNQAYASRPIDSQRIEAAAHRFGFAGVVIGFAAESLETGDVEALVHTLIATLPSNHHISRYGVTAARDDQDFAVVFGAMEARLLEFPRSVPRGGTIRLSGKIGNRFERATVIVTNSDGTIHDFPMRSRDVNATLRFDQVGAHRVEVSGDGPNGPDVIVNVPIFVGVAEQDPSFAPATDPGVAVPPDVAEARLLELINASRQKAGLRPLAPDPELRRVALAHSIDMAQHGFVGHISPTTGSPDDRLQRSDIQVSVAAENVALEATPEGVHAGLMNSPGHRANILRSDFTHVGIGITLQPGLVQQQPKLIATELFGRRPPPEAARQTPESTLSAIQSLRAKHGMGAVRVDAVLSSAADSGMRAYLSTTPPSGPRANQAAIGALQSHANKTGKNYPSLCFGIEEMLELPQLEQVSMLSDPNLLALGFSSKVLEDGGVPRLLLVVVFEGSEKAPLACR